MGASSSAAAADAPAGRASAPGDGLLASLPPRRQPQPARVSSAGGTAVHAAQPQTQPQPQTRRPSLAERRVSQMLEDGELLELPITPSSNASFQSAREAEDGSDGGHSETSSPKRRGVAEVERRRAERTLAT
eukprot:SRR837773.16389.p4 GENE.SRR837773.16389~~SRR837773.16389.p4  ORF type:complete len:146 (-),score=3.39 SRR837773.16389:33-428(-)